MSKTEENEILRKAFAAAMNSPSSALRPPSSAFPTPHPIDDEDLLLDWSAGDLPAERHEQLLDHLAACPACRREIAAMVRAGALVLPHVDASFVVPPLGGEDRLKPALPTPVSERPGYVAPARRWRQRTVFALIVALAASLLLVFARGLFDTGPRRGGTPIAMAQRDLEQGRTSEAFNRIDDYLSQADQLTVTADDRRQAAAILESSGYELARSGLVKGDFRRVSDVDHRVARHTSGSARLRNLRIQAERGETAEQSLSRRRSLVRDYGYETNGQRLIKDFSIPEITATVRRIDAEWVAAIEAFPDAIDLRLNYGHFLMEQNDFQRAETVFAEAVVREPRNVLARTGLGLALFQQNRPETIQRALEPFQKAVELSPNDPGVNMNLAVCLTRLGREAEAHPYFEKAQ